ncbi:MAG: hypothetical protein K2N51_15110 [Lachnospiraceae bacterium]|nr:hypothetical protein [Lachnospiraceae bacterium]
MFELLRPEDLVWLVGVGTTALATIVQKMSSKYKPWSWLAQQFGKAVNKEMMDKLEELEKKVDKLEKIDKRQDEERAEENALEARRRILRFADECRRNEKHSEEYFNNILEDISMYKDYCHEHPLFENEKAVMAMSFIDDVYNHCYKNNDFL